MNHFLNKTVISDGLTTEKSDFFQCDRCIESRVLFPFAQAAHSPRHQMYRAMF